MYDIAANEIQAFNGIGDTADGGTKSGSSLDWTSIINTTIKEGAGVANTAINANNQTGTNTNQGSGTYTGGSPGTYSPSTFNVGSKKEETDYMPWILGGVAAVALIAVLMGNNNKRR
jgi:hypothetical protein